MAERMISGWIKVFGWEGIRVNNCPMCGRKLKGAEHEKSI